MYCNLPKLLSVALQVVLLVLLHVCSFPMHSGQNGIPCLILSTNWPTSHWCNWEVYKRPQFICPIFLFAFWAWLILPPQGDRYGSISFGTLVGPLTRLHPKMKLLRCREPREPETLVFLHFTWFYDYKIRVKSTSNFPHSCLWYDIS